MAEEFLKAWEVPTTQFPNLPLPKAGGDGNAAVIIQIEWFGGPTIYTDGAKETHAPYRYGAPFVYEELTDHVVKWYVRPCATQSSGHGITRETTGSLAITVPEYGPTVYGLYYRHPVRECKPDELHALIVQSAFKIVLFTPALPPRRKLDDIINEIAPKDAEIKKFPEDSEHIRIYSSKPRPRWLVPEDYKHQQGYLLAYTYTGEDGTPHIRLKGNGKSSYRREGIYKSDTIEALAHINGKII